MNRTIDRLKIIFLGIFILGAVASWGYQALWVWPARNCEANGNWWDPSARTCAHPIYIPDITGRPAGMTREEWSKKKAAETVQKGL
jgi:hypothetical protein